MYNLMHNGIKCNDVYLQRCLNHLIPLKFIEKVNISEINIISYGCPNKNTGYGILEKKNYGISGLAKNLYWISGLRSPI